MSLPLYLSHILIDLFANSQSIRFKRGKNKNQLKTILPMFRNNIITNTNIDFKKEICKNKIDDIWKFWLFNNQYVFFLNKMYVFIYNIINKEETRYLGLDENSSRPDDDDNSKGLKKYESTKKEIHPPIDRYNVGKIFDKHSNTNFA